MSLRVKRGLHQGFVLVLCGVIAVQPMMLETAYAQDIIIDPSGNVGFGPTMQKTNRPPVVDIARPNSGGVSHNKYTKFVATSKGVILNNSTGAVATTIGGNIAGNPNLNGSAASTILNEVTGSTASSLLGTVEVAGTKAHVIIANPNGISCNGCSFINAGSATLSTGVPTVDGGTVRLDVTGGTVSIGSRGLDAAANGVAAVNLVGRFVVIDGKVTAVDSINVQAGPQGWDATSNQSTGALSPVTGGVTGDFGVDATAFGAMEAGRITIVGNEAGFGVRTSGALSAGAGWVSVKAKEDVSVRSATASGTVTVSSSEKTATIERDVSSSAGKVNVSGKLGATMLAEAGAYGATGLSFSSTHGDVNISGDLQAGSDIIATSTRGTLTFSGYVHTAGSTSLSGRLGVDLDGATIFANAFSAVSSHREVSLQSSAVFTAQDVIVTAVNFHLGTDVIIDGLSTAHTSKLVATASGTFRNSADMRHHTTAQITYDGALINEATGIIESDALVLAFAQAVTNAGVLYGNQSVRIDVSRFTNTETGVVMGASVDVTTTSNLVNKGLISADGDLRLISGTKIDNDGVIQGNRAYLTAPKIIALGASEIRGTALIQASATTSFTQQGTIGTPGSFSVTTASFSNTGQIIAETALTVLGAAAITNDGMLVSAKNISLTASSSIVNRGTISSYERATLASSGYVENRGTLLADTTLSITGPRFSNLGESALVRAKAGGLSTDTIINSGRVFLVDRFRRQANIDLFQNDGIFASEGNIEISGRNATSQAVIGTNGILIAGLVADSESQTLIAGRAISLNLSSITFSGQLSAGGDISVVGGNAMTLDGRIQTANSNITLDAAALTLGTKSVIYAGGQVRVNATGGLTNHGQMISIGRFQLGDGFGFLSNTGGISFRNTHSFTLAGEFSNSGVFAATGALSITAARITSSGAIQAGAGITLNSSSQLTLSGALVAEGAMSLRGTAIETADNTRIAATQLEITGTSFVNHGDLALSGTANNNWTLTAGYTQNGLAWSAGALRISAANAAVHSGSLLATGSSLTITTVQGISISGKVNAASVTFTGNGITAGTNSSIVTTDNLTLAGLGAGSGSVTLAGEVLSGKSLTITGYDIGLAGQVFGDVIKATAGRDVTVTGRLSATAQIEAMATRRVTNSGTIEASNQVTLDGSNVTNNAGAEIASTRLLLIAAANVSNAGKLRGAQDITVRSNSFGNEASARIDAGSLGFDVQTWFTNKGVIDVFGVFGTAGGTANNSGSINAETYFGLSARDFINNTLEGRTGTLTSNGHVYVKTTGSLGNRADSSITGKTIDLVVGSLNNVGTLRAAEILTASSSTGTIVNEDAGKIYGKTIVLAAGSTFTNAGTIGQTSSSSLPRAILIQLASGKLASATTALLTNSGLLRATDIILDGRGGLGNTTTGQIQAGRDISITSANGGFTNDGLLRAERYLLVDVSGTFNNIGTTDGKEALRVTAGTVKNQVEAGSAGSITGKVVLLEARNGGISNDAGARISGSVELGLNALAGDINNVGTLSSPDIALVAQAGGVWIPAALSTNGKLYASGRSVSLTGVVSATNAVTLVSTAFDVIVGSRITTKSLMIEAARDLNAVAGSLRGSDLTQIVANDIVRTDITETNRKLGAISASHAKNNIYVSLRTGNLGTYTASNTSGYEVASFDVSGSIAIRTEIGSMYLRGTVTAAGDLAFYAGTEAGFRSATLTAGNILTLEGGDRVKNFGSLTFSAGNTAQILQGSGWFYTTDWLPKNVSYHLVVFAKRIVVDSSHRFVNKSVMLRATEDIRQRDQAISARKITYAAGQDIIVEFDGFDWRDANPGVTATSDWWDVESAGLRGHVLLSQGQSTTLYAGRDVNLISGKIQTGGDLTITAGRDVISEPIYLESYEDSRPANIGWSFSNDYKAVLSGHDATKVQLTELRAYENILTVAGNVSITANGNITLIGTKVTAGGDLMIHSNQGTITLAAAPGVWVYNYQTSSTRRSGLFGAKKKVTTITHDAYIDLYKRTTLSAENGTVSIVSTGLRSATEDYSTIISAGTLITANNVRISTLGTGNATNRAGSISLGTYTEVNASTTRSHTRSSYFGITYRKKTNTGTDTLIINKGNDLLADDILTIASGNNLNITGGRLAGQNISISAVGNLNILAAINSERQERYIETQNLVTITTIQEGYDRETADLPQITSPNPISFTIGGAVHIAGAPGMSLNDQLLTVVGSGQYSSKLHPLHSAAAATASAAAATAVTDKFTRTFVLPGASNGAQYAYLDTLVNDFGATYHEIALRDHSWYDKQVRLTPAFQALLTIASTYFTGGAGLGLSGAQQAAANALISGGIEGAITGNVDVGLLLRSAALAGVSTYVSDMINSSFKLGTNGLGLSDRSPFASGLGQQFSPVAIVDRAGSQIVNTVVANVVNGNAPFTGFDTLGRTFVVTETMGVLQFGVGEIGGGNGKWEGSLAHMLLHGGVGCVAIEAMNGNCASGFFAGVSQSVLAGSWLADEQKRDLAPLVGGLAGFLWADGEAVGVNFASVISRSAMENNYLTHAEWSAYLDALAECGNDAACLRNVNAWAEKRALENQHDLLTCRQTDTCSRHTDLIKEADGFRRQYGQGSAFVQRLQNQSYHWAANNYSYDHRDTGYTAEDVIYGDFHSSYCGSLSNADCVRAFEITVELRRTGDVQTQLGLLGLLGATVATGVTGCGGVIGCVLMAASAGMSIDQIETGLDNASGITLEETNIVHALMLAGADRDQARSIEFWIGVGLGTADLALIAARAPSAFSRITELERAATNTAPNRTLTQIDTPVDLTNGRGGHILANHRAGSGKVGKTEFPSNWDDQRIIHQVSDISIDPTLIRHIDTRGSPYVSGTRDGLDIRVTFFPDSHARAGQISSAYPTNVPANPRP